MSDPNCTLKWIISGEDETNNEREWNADSETNNEDELEMKFIKLNLLFIKMS